MTFEPVKSWKHIDHLLSYSTASKLNARFVANAACPLLSPCCWLSRPSRLAFHDRYDRTYAYHGDTPTLSLAIICREARQSRPCAHGPRRVVRCRHGVGQTMFEVQASATQIEAPLTVVGRHVSIGFWLIQVLATAAALQHQVSFWAEIWLGFHRRPCRVALSCEVSSPELPSRARRQWRE